MLTHLVTDIKVCTIKSGEVISSTFPYYKYYYNRSVIKLNR